ncbi:ATP-dependent helicase HrpA, partial [Corallococcus sp. CA053C]
MTRRQRAPRLDWAGLLQCTFKQDVLLRGRCGGRRRLLAYLAHSPAVRHVLEHLKRPLDGPPLA